MNKKTLLIVLAVFSSGAFAFGHGSYCMAHSDVVAKDIAKNGGSMTINYSADEKSNADKCKAALMGQNKNLKITETQVDGSGKFSFAK